MEVLAESGGGGEDRSGLIGDLGEKVFLLFGWFGIYQLLAERVDTIDFVLELEGEPEVGIGFLSGNSSRSEVKELLLTADEPGKGSDEEKGEKVEK